MTSRKVICSSVRSSRTVGVVPSGMPSDFELERGASRSINRIFSSSAIRRVRQSERLTEVVVLPTPPFWIPTQTRQPFLSRTAESVPPGGVTIADLELDRTRVRDDQKIRARTDEGRPDRAGSRGRCLQPGGLQCQLAA